MVTTNMTSDDFKNDEIGDDKGDDIGDIIVVADVGHVEGGVLICWGCFLVGTSETGSLRVTGCRVVLSQ